MRKLLIYSFLILCSSVLFGQETLVNSVTSVHKEIRGSKIKMIPPSGFISASSFKGFQQIDGNASIMILDVAKPFSAVMQGLTSESLSKQGVKVVTIKAYILNNLPATLIKSEQVVNEILFTKYILVTGTDEETILINGLIPHDQTVIEKIVKETILSSIYDSEKIIEPLDVVDFQINTKNSGLKLAKIQPNMLIFNHDGKIPTEVADKTSIVVAKTFSQLLIADKKSFALNKIRTLPIQINKIRSTLPITIDGLKGYEVVAQGQNRKTGHSESVYQAILFSNEGYYIIYGSSESNISNNLLLFKDVAQTFKLK
ncbi:hypothetical protein [Flavobacterium tegetincola]|uniref:hypothetical protein n=1 Tax=Flavobacterium tegetincola TaxID=150172 RepID=UPI0004271023|nr:hypothetical protein [Flavobacterium tegetincola]